MASAVLDRNSDESVSPNRALEHAEIAQLRAELLAVPGIERFAQQAFEQMQHACQSADRDYPKWSSTPCQFMGTAELITRGLEQLINQGPRNEVELRVLGVLALTGAANRWPTTSSEVLSLAYGLFWLESESGMSALHFAVEVLGSEHLSQLAEALHQMAATNNGASRGQTYLAAMWSRALAGDRSCLNTIASVLGGVSTPHTSEQVSSSSIKRSISGRVLGPPRGPFITALAAFSGWLLLRHLTSYVSRHVLAYRTQAQLCVSDRGIEIREQTSMLGRRLRDRSRLITLQTVRSLSREVRYARAGTYVGLASLAIGSFVGMRLFVDGVRAPGFSGPTMLLGLLVALAGLGLDFAFANWLDSSRAQCRLSIETVRGRGLYLTCDEPAKVDRVLTDLADRLTA